MYCTIFVHRRRKAMAVYLFCKECKSTYNVSLKKCPKCDSPTPSRNKVFRVSVMINGKRVTRTIPNSIERAQQIEAKIKGELIDDEYFDRREKIPTLGEIWKDYHESHKATGKAWAQDKSRYETVLKDRFEKKPLDEISPFDVNRLMVDMKGTTSKRKTAYTPKSIKNAHELLSRIFNYAINVKSYEGSNPCKKAKLKEVHNEVTNVLDDKQIKNLLTVLDAHEDKPTSNLIKLLLFTGMRRGEAFNLTWQRVDLKAGWIYLEETKGGKPEKLPINELAHQVLKDQEDLKNELEKQKTEKENPKPEKVALVFPNRKGEKLMDIKRKWAKIKEGAGIPVSFRLHDLRHTFASLLANSGEVDLYTIQKLLTHKSPKMTQRYAHLVDEARKKGSRTLEGIILKAQESTDEDESKSQLKGA